ncbi:MAG: hypothetical protein ACM3U2_20720 [Deltaproteobacteria bacterium]
MARRKIKRRRGEGISISGPATVHVSRRVMLIIDAPREARVARLAKQRDSRPITK